MSKTPIDELNRIVEYTFNLANCSPLKVNDYSKDEIASTIKGESIHEKIAHARLIRWMMFNNWNHDLSSLDLLKHELAYIHFFYDCSKANVFVEYLIEYMNYDKLDHECQSLVIHHQLTKTGKINAVIEQIAGIDASTNKNYVAEIKKKLLDIRNTVLCRVAHLFDTEADFDNKLKKAELAIDAV